MRTDNLLLLLYLPITMKEEGKYVNGKKEGLWKFYYPSGKIKQEVTYKNNRPNGFVRIYYENGNVSEEGIWKGNKWVGKYKYYHKNGKLAYDWNYNENGKRDGVQKYYYENGNIMIEGNWKNGKENGVLREYDENGNSVIDEVKRISKPGRRVYKGYEDIKKFKNGFGTLVVSTNKGVLANDEAYKLKIGGEVICSIW